MDPEIRGKITKIDTFINDVLRADLVKLEEKLDSKTTLLAEFMQLKNVIGVLQRTQADKNGFKTKVDIGRNFFVQAHVEDASQILLNVGLDHYVEFTLDEALVLLNVRVKLIEKQIEHFREQVSMTNAHIKFLLLGISELQQSKEGT